MAVLLRPCRSLRGRFGISWTQLFVAPRHILETAPSTPRVWSLLSRSSSISRGAVPLVSTTIIILIIALLLRLDLLPQLLILGISLGDLIAAHADVDEASYQEDAAGEDADLLPDHRWVWLPWLERKVIVGRGSSWHFWGGFVACVRCVLMHGGSSRGFGSGVL